MENANRPNEIKYITSSGVYKTPFSLIILVQLFVGGIVFVLVNLWFWSNLNFLLGGEEFYPVETGVGWLDSFFDPNWTNWILLPLNIYGNIMLFAFTIILFSAGVNKAFMADPKEGIFKRGSKEWKSVHRRFWLAYFPIWLARALPLPWADIVCYRFFGVKIGKNVVAYEGYIDPGFVEIGDFTMTSLHICIFSHNLYHDEIIVKKVSIGKNCIVGPQTIVSPGTIMREEAILGANSYTWIGQDLKENLIHVGTPVNYSFPVQSVEESQAKAEKRKKVKTLDELEAEEREAKNS